MKGVWVNKRYAYPYQSRRHFFEDDGWVKTKAPPQWNKNLTNWDYVQSMTGKSLCGRIASYHGLDWDNPFTKKVIRKGGLSIRKKVRLTQRNLCHYCLKKYIMMQSKEVQSAFNLLSQLR